MYRHILYIVNLHIFGGGLILGGVQELCQVCLGTKFAGIVCVGERRPHWHEICIDLLGKKTLDFIFYYLTFCSIHAMIR